MYRQILESRDTDYQRIVVLDQLVDDEGAAFPFAVPVLRHQTYVDGADDQILARQTRNQLRELLKKGGFHLRKWASNWLNQSPSRWKIFVSNRVSAVQSLLPGVSWRHVPTHTNPADCTSRGLVLDLFKTHALWWSSPPWLHHPPESWLNSCPSVPSNIHLKQRPEPLIRTLHFPVGSCVALLFVTKISTNYRVPVSFSSTLLCRIEAYLDSRPIALISDNLEDYHALFTPRSFFGLWRAWSGDYLHTLQQRPKWRIVQRLAKVGQIVLVRNPLAPLSQWELGRITACHPGDDNLTRVVIVKTERSEYKRPIAKLCFYSGSIPKSLRFYHGGRIFGKRS
ncbi:hypothetical protein ALC56_03890 [Trachymyrmex septentrionalis]|uniref:DUF5641 domain-containing protein n=1 Tax=Trachymyrmex septentrionalis TaxID=34720 RepID=A0A195FN50_9HYME|nr:hypothetical protein ALC56_03890 [Trachymyrmex septentrionalis]